MSYLVTTKFIKDADLKFDKYFVRTNTKFQDVFSNERELVIVEGFLYDLKENKQLNIEELLILLRKFRKEKSVFPDYITGQYNIVYINDNKIDLINDFVGMYPLNYYLEEDIFITNNVYDFFEFGFKIEETYFFQSFIGNLYAPLNGNTLFAGVKKLRAGEYIHYCCDNSEIESIIDSIDIENARINKSDVNKIAYELKNNGLIFKNIFNKFLFALSGGVDSRVVLSSFDTFEKNNMRAFSYGEEDYIDNKIAKQICKNINVSHDNISFINSLFPTNEQFDDLINKGKEYFVGGCWFSTIDFLKKNNYQSDSVIILGDLLDLLRNKNLKSIRSKKARKEYQIKKILGFKFKEPQLDKDKFINNLKKDFRNKIKILQQDFPNIVDTYKLDELAFLNKTDEDIEGFVNYLINKTNPKNQYNLEEVYNIFTWGAGTMGKQTTIFKDDYKCYALLANRHIVKILLNYSTLDKFEDTLTHKLLMNKEFGKFSIYPTAQIPFVAYNKNIYIKYLIWWFRNSVDQKRIKKGKGRLIKHIEWKKYYENLENRKTLENLLKDIDPKLKQYSLDIYDKRASGEIWPLNETDIGNINFLLKMKQYNK